MIKNNKIFLQSHPTPINMAGGQKQGNIPCFHNALLQRSKVGHAQTFLEGMFYEFFLIFLSLCVFYLSSDTTFQVEAINIEALPPGLDTHNLYTQHLTETWDLSKDLPTTRETLVVDCNLVSFNHKCSPCGC